MLKKDNLKLGLVLGFIAPVAGLFGYYLVRFRLFSLKDFFEVLMAQKSLLTAIISISLMANALVFTFYINRRKDKTAKGVFVATCIYALISLFIKWFA
ncbi:hypothetical protein [Asinibacterium sp. OR53]|uniref:hypothetical protein n=1 Tax=Asinibacterium sp. OR53 TaxID=925409 RepID=UPI0004AE1CC6|nr:hypothetical protein [Asinibacterium sp. OR53]